MHDDGTGKSYFRYADKQQISPGVDEKLFHAEQSCVREERNKKPPLTPHGHILLTIIEYVSTTLKQEVEFERGHDSQDGERKGTLHDHAHSTKDESHEKDAVTRDEDMETLSFRPQAISGGQSKPGPLNQANNHSRRNTTFGRQAYAYIIGGIHGRAWVDGYKA